MKDQRKPFSPGILLVTGVSTLLGLASTSAVCSSLHDIDGDSQSVFLWRFAAFRGSRLYTDISYLYGILSYYKNASLFANFLWILIIPTLCIGVFLLIKFLFRNKVQSSLAGGSFFLFVFLFSGVTAFQRYGVSVILGSWIALLFSGTRKSRSIVHFLVGIGDGLIFSLINDQGLYLLGVYTVLLLLSTLRWRTTIFGSLKLLTADVFLFIVGFVCGAFPFVIYLLSHNALIPFFRLLLHYQQIALLADTPFLPFSLAQVNLFTFGALFFTLTSVTYKSIRTHLRLREAHTLVQIAMLTTLFLFEQKSLIRSIALDLTFVGFLLYLLLWIDIQSLVPKLKSWKGTCVFGGLLFLFFLNGPLSLFPQAVHNELNIRTPHLCTANTFSTKYLDIPPQYKEVVSEILNQDPQARIFSIPVDPIFYVLFNQMPPYETTLYEGTSRESQQKSISYITSQHITYVILNLRFSDTDGVPTVIRGATLLRYVLEHFTPVKTVNDFLILRRQDTLTTFDPFTYRNLFPAPFDQQLRILNMGHIPLSEGTYHAAWLKQRADLRFNARSESELHSYIETHILMSDHLTLLLKTSSPQPARSLQVNIETETVEKSTLTMSDCDRGICIVHFDTLPLFWTPRHITSLSFSPSFLGEIQLYSLPDVHPLW